MFEIAAVGVVAILTVLGFWLNRIWLVVGLILQDIWNSFSPLSALDSAHKLLSTFCLIVDWLADVRHEQCGESE